MQNIVIGIQARTGSTRLPNKVHLPLNGKSVLQWVIDAAFKAINRMEQVSRKTQTNITVCLLVPEKDPIISIHQAQMDVLAGHPTDVLSRYVAVQKRHNADYIVRITADCPLIPPFIIAKHIQFAIKTQKDFVTNCMVRTFKEGWDVQVMSKRLLEWVETHAKNAVDREHVCTAIKAVNFPFKDSEGKPNILHVLNQLDESGTHTSIDTPEDYKNAELTVQKTIAARKLAYKIGSVGT